MRVMSTKIEKCKKLTGHLGVDLGQLQHPFPGICFKLIQLFLSRGSAGLSLIERFLVFLGLGFLALLIFSCCLLQLGFLALSFLEFCLQPGYFIPFLLEFCLVRFGSDGHLRGGNALLVLICKGYMPEVTMLTCIKCSKCKIKHRR